MTSFSARIMRHSALGQIEADHDVNGPDELVAKAVLSVLERMLPGDRLDVRVPRNLPADHPLVGIDLDVTLSREEPRRHG
ncbi:MAG: hypothetical protein M3376_06425 [Actinomycetota bacterium]|nr:hypothetical protein [Actinomycetota bacterium]